MSSLLALAYALSLLVTGFALVRYLWPDSTPGLALALAFGTSAVLNAGLSFLRLWTQALNLSFQAQAVSAAGVLSAVFLLYAWRRSSHVRRPSTREPVFAKRMAFTLVALQILVCFSIFVYARHGGIDAWLHWNLKARYLWRSGPHWQDFFKAGLGFTHPDYPLLLPLNVSTFYTLLQNDPASVGIFVAAGFTLSLILLLYAGGKLLCGTGARPLAVFLLAPTVGATCAKQYADPPLAYFFLASALCLHQAFASGRSRLFLLAGIAAGGAAATKNEGIAFFAASVATVLIWISINRSKKNFSGFLYFLLGAAPGLVPTLLFKLLVAPCAAAVERTGLSALYLTADWADRALYAFGQLFAFLLRPGTWAWIPLVFASVCLARLLALRFRPCLSPAFRSAFLPVFFMPAAYLAAYLVAQNVEPHWLVRATENRLFLQIWPSLVLAGFMLLTCEGKEACAKVVKGTQKLKNSRIR